MPSARGIPLCVRMPRRKKWRGVMPSARGISLCARMPRRKERRRERLTAAPQSQRLLTNKDINKKALIPKNQGFFLVVTPTGFEPVLPP